MSRRPARPIAQADADVMSPAKLRQVAGAMARHREAHANGPGGAVYLLADMMRYLDAARDKAVESAFRDVARDLRQTAASPTPLEHRVISLARRSGALSEACDYIDCDLDAEGAREHWRVKPALMDIINTITNATP